MIGLRAGVAKRYYGACSCGVLGIMTIPAPISVLNPAEHFRRGWRRYTRRAGPHVAQLSGTVFSVTERLFTFWTGAFVIVSPSLFNSAICS